MKLIFGNKKKIAIHIEDDSISILVGNATSIVASDNIKLPNGICEDGNIIRREVISNFINDYLEDNKIKAKEVSFVIGGTNVISRYIEVPIMKDDALRETLEYEFSEFIPQIDDYYIDYEIVEKIVEEDKKAYKILLVACLKEQIDVLVDISEDIDKELDVIDISSNCVARVISRSSYYSSENSVGVLYLGENASTFSIIENGNSKIERNLPFGVNNILGEGSNNKVHNIYDMLENDDRLKMSFENLLSTMGNTLRYYNSDWKNKLVNKFIIICDSLDIENLDKYMSEYFTIPCMKIESPSDLDLKIELDKNFSKYIPAYGLFLRRE